MLLDGKGHYVLVGELRLDQPVFAAKRLGPHVPEVRSFILTVDGMGLKGFGHAYNYI